MDPHPGHSPAMRPSPISGATLPYYEEPAVPPPPRPAWATWTDKGDFVKWAFYSGLAAGVLILLCAFSMALLMTMMNALGGPGLAWPWVDAEVRADGDADWLAPFLLALWGLVTGGMVLLGALRLKETPHNSAMPGLLILVGGLLSFLALGGFLLGGLLAIASGVLAVAGARSVFNVRGPRLRGEPPGVP